MADCWVRLGFALTAIVLLTAAFYQAGSPRGVAIETVSLSAAQAAGR
jgi:hypothetical protein